VKHAQSSSFLSHGNCTISFDSLKYSAELISPAAMAFANTGLPERDSGGRAQRVPDIKFDPDDGEVNCVLFGIGGDLNVDFLWDCQRLLCK
jgi:hypothetical protein